MKVLRKVRDLLMERADLYQVEPIKLLTDDELIAIIHMKFYRVKYGKDRNKRMDDLLDLIAYAVRLAERWCDESQRDSVCR